MRLLFVGEAAPRGAEPLSGRSGKRLAQLLGLTLDEFLAAHDRVNVLTFRPHVPGEKGDRFPAWASKTTLLLLPHLVGRRVVLLGKRVAGGFGIRGPRYMAPERILGAEAVLIFPHPSGVNRWFNDPRNVALAKSTLRAFSRGEPLRLVGS